MHPLELIRRSCGYQMPRLGLWANHLFHAVRPKHIRCELVPGIFADLDLDDDTAGNIFYLGRRYEAPTLNVLESWIGNGATHFLDIGANFGYFSFALLQRFPHLRALALEPHPDTFQKLQTIAIENRVSRLNYLQIAAGNRHEDVVFICDPKNSGASHITSETEADAPGRITITSAPLDGILRDQGLNGVRSIAKIDVEGHELAVLQGMTSTLRQRSLSGLCIEMNTENLARAGTTPARVADFLLQHGYQRVQFEVRGASNRSDNWFFEPIR